MSRTQTIATGYQPRVIQAELHRRLKRFNVIVAHRRFGKTVFCINEMVDQALRCKKPNPRYAYLAPLYGQAKRVAWDYLKMYTEKIPGASANEADLRVDLPHNGARFTLLGADNPASLKGIYLDGVILDEYADMNPMAWSEVIRPTLSDRQGWGVFIGTPKGQNAFYKMWLRSQSGEEPEWFGAMYKASQTGILAPPELESAAKEMTEEEYEQEFECSFNAGIQGAYFVKELATAEAEGRIGDFPYDPMLPVDTYWDLGSNDLCAVWMVQTQRGMHRAIDYFEISGSDVPKVVAELKRRPYVFGRWVLPHDARQKNFATGKSAESVFYSLGCRPLTVVERCSEKRDSINAARMIFGKMQFNRPKVQQGLDHLAKYQKKWDAKNQVFQDAPLHNIASNCADAFQTFALGVKEEANGLLSSRNLHGHEYLEAESSFNPYDY
jgi:phage terminase large subunit